MGEDRWWLPVFGVLRGVSRSDLENACVAVDDDEFGVAALQRFQRLDGGQVQ